MMPDNQMMRLNQPKPAEPQTGQANGVLWVGGYCALPIAAVVIAVAILAGCSNIQRTPPLQVWPDMRLQDRFETQRAVEPEELKQIFADGRESRRRPDGVVARGHMLEDSVMNTGMENGLYIGKMPVEVTEELLNEGHWRFNTYCAPCHDQTGLGRGMVPLRFPGWQPQNLMEQRIVDMADGQIFNTITYGIRTMPPYGAPNRPNERWAIIAYLRLLQRSAHGTIEDVPEQLRSSLEYKPAPPQPEAPPLPPFDLATPGAAGAAPGAAPAAAPPAQKGGK